MMNNLIKYKIETGTEIRGNPVKRNCRLKGRRIRSMMVIDREIEE